MKLDKELIVDKEDFKVPVNTLAITPLVENLKHKHQKRLRQLNDFYEKYKDRRDSVKVVNIEANSLYKTCVNIGLLLNIRSKRIRKAYEQALKSIEGNEFECNKILVMVG